MTQIEAGAKVERDRSWISKVENGHVMPKWPQIEALLDAYKMMAAELFGQVDIESEDHIRAERYHAQPVHVRKAIDLLLGMPQKEDGKKAERK